MMIFSLVAMIGLDKCCITSACLQWLCHSGERIVARGPLVSWGRGRGGVGQVLCNLNGNGYTFSGGNSFKSIFISLINRALLLIGSRESPGSAKQLSPL